MRTVGSLVLLLVIFHSLHNPVRMILRILLLPFLRLHFFLHKQSATALHFATEQGLTFISNFSGTLTPLATASLPCIFSNHVRSAGKGPVSIPAHSAQFTQLKHDKSAMLNLPPTIQPLLWLARRSLRMRYRRFVSVW